MKPITILNFKLNLTMHLIAQHIPDTALNIPIIEIKDLGICAFTGQPLTKACLKKDVIGGNFTDHTYLRYQSSYISTDIAKLIVGKAVNGNGLRNYSFYADNEGLQVLSREDIWHYIFLEKPMPFVLCVTFNNKKHIAFKATPQYNSNHFRIYTDIGECEFDYERLKDAIEVMQKWYTVVKGKEETTLQPTYFTKANILGESIPSHTQILAYGEDKYRTDNEILERFRGTLTLKVLVHLLNKEL